MARAAEDEHFVSYVALVREFIPCPLKSEDDSTRAMVVVEKLLTREHLSPGEVGYLDAVSTFIQAYEAEHVKFDDVHGVEMLKTLMEMNDLKQRDLIPEFGSASHVSDVINGRRQLSKAVILKLAERFNVSPVAFLPV